MNSEPAASRAQRSTFVTVVAWIFIVLSGFTTLVSLLQNIMLHTVFAQQGFDPAAIAANAPEGQPVLVTFLVAHVAWFFALVLFVSITLLCSSVGLLMRKNWARLMFIGVMVLGIAWDIFGFALQFQMLGTLTEMHHGAPAEFRNEMRTVAIVMGVFGAVLGLAFITLFGWLIKRFMSASVRQEFRARA